MPGVQLTHPDYASLVDPLSGEPERGLKDIFPQLDDIGPRDGWLVEKINICLRVPP